MPRSLLIPFVLASTVPVACGLDDVDVADPDADLDLQARSSGDYNFSGVHHAADYVRLKTGSAPLRDGDFNPIGLTVRPTDIRGRCQNCIRIQGIEALRTPRGTLYYSWGHGGNESGFVHVADLASRPRIDDSASAGNGASCPAKRANRDLKSYFIDPQPIPGRLRYIGPSDGVTRSMKHYGTPGAPAAPHYTYLSWSWVNRRGGGIVRTLMQRGEVFYPCNVRTITTRSHCGSDRTCDDGWVKVMYGFTRQGERRIYGWTVHSHKYENNPTVPHVICRNC